MPGRKALLAKTMSASGLIAPVTRLRSLFRREIAILAYHRVLDCWDEQSYPFDPDLISATTEDFHWQMGYIREHYSPVSFRQVLLHLDGAAPLPPRPIIVTFDDGFDDNYLHAFPVLQALNVPATVFVSTGYIGQPRTFWFDWLYFLCNQAAHAGIPVRIDGVARRLSRDLVVRREEIADILSSTKRLPDALLRRELGELEKDLGMQSPTEVFPQSHPLSWEQVRRMAAGGIEFGSHTVTHPILANLTPKQLEDELSISKAELEQQLKCPVDVIAYPVGGKFTFNSVVVQAVRKAGFKIATSYMHGINNVNSLDRFSLRRLRVERYTTREDFKGMLALPELFS